MEKTTNFNLNKPEAGDPLRVSDFNENADKIDAALGTFGEQLLKATSISGTYTMKKSSAVNVTLGFRPKLVFIVAQGSSGYGLAVLMDGIVIRSYYDETGSKAYVNSFSATVSDTGFTMPASSPYFNDVAGRNAYYVAVR